MNDIVIVKKSDLKDLLQKSTYFASVPTSIMEKFREAEFQQVKECFEVMPGEIRIGYTDILSGEYLEAGIKRAEGTQELANKYLRAMNEQQIAEIVEARYEPLKEDFAMVSSGCYTRESFEFNWDHFKKQKVKSIMELKANLKF